MNKQTQRFFGVATKSGKLTRGNILEQYALKADGDDEKKTKQIVDPFKGSYDKGLVQPPYNPHSLANLLDINVFHSRCVHVKARDTGGLGWELQRSDGEARETDAEMDRVQAALEAMHPLNDTLTRAQTDFETIGWASVELIRADSRADGEPVEIKHLPAKTLRVHNSGRKYAQRRGNKTRFFKAAGLTEIDIDLDTGDESPAGTLPAPRRANEVVYWLNYSPQSDFYGIPDIIPALGTLHGDFGRREYNRQFFENHGVPAYAILISGNIDEGEIDDDGKSDLQKEIEDRFAEIQDNPHSSLIMTLPTRDKDSEVKIEFKPLANDVKDASFRMYRKDNRDEILAAHGVDPYRIGVAETGSLGGTAAVEARKIYKASVVEPRQEVIQHLFTLHVIKEGFGIEGLRFDLSEIDTEDEKHEMEQTETLFGLGAVSPNEIRARFGFDPVDHPAMDMHYVQGRAIDGEDVQLDIVERSMKSLKESIEAREHGSDKKTD